MTLIDCRRRVTVTSDGQLPGPDWADETTLCVKVSTPVAGEVRKRYSLRHCAHSLGSDHAFLHLTIASENQGFLKSFRCTTLKSSLCCSS